MEATLYILHQLQSQTTHNTQHTNKRIHIIISVRLNSFLEISQCNISFAVTPREGIEELLVRETSVNRSIARVILGRLDSYVVRWNQERPNRGPSFLRVCHHPVYRATKLPITNHLYIHNIFLFIKTIPIHLHLWGNLEIYSKRDIFSNSK